MNWDDFESEHNTAVQVIMMVVISLLMALIIFLMPLIYVLLFQPSMNDIPTPLFKRLR
jgi:hypothetical protein